MPMRTAKPERTLPVVGAALAIAAVGTATILGAYYFEYVLHYQPCPLCLEQRIPYYVGIPLAQRPCSNRLANRHMPWPSCQRNQMA
jgi:disulfide bond formation protein DsbB